MSLALASAALVYVAHRPDSDDANFVGFAADAIAHPELPVLSHDVLYGGHELPLILPTYAVDSYELFIALLAHWFGRCPNLVGTRGGSHCACCLPAICLGETHALR